MFFLDGPKAASDGWQLCNRNRALLVDDDCAEMLPAAAVDHHAVSTVGCGAHSKKPAVWTRSIASTVIAVTTPFAFCLFVCE